MYVYRSSSFNDELKKDQNLASRVENLCSSIEKMNLVSVQETFKRIHGYIKLRLGRQFRIIAKLIKIEGEPILCLLKVYLRGEPEYRIFLERVKHKNNLFQESDLIPDARNWLNQQQNNYPLVTPNTINNSLRVWLEKPQWNLERNELIIYESIFWSQQFAKEEFQDYLPKYRQLIESLVANYRRIGKETETNRIRFYNQENITVVFSNIITEDKPQEEVLLLIAPLLGKEAEIQELIKPIIDTAASQTWWRKYHKLSIDDLINDTKRSYPGYLVLDEEVWLQIQDGDQVNLALSEEEKNLLVNSSLPLFLNGRAGSGKSTMLFYLFAYYCRLYLQLRQDNVDDYSKRLQPLFLTYSPSLSDFARVKVQSILKHHHYFITDNNDREGISQTSCFFQPLRSFLLSLLPGSIRPNFTEDKYISFHNFRELLQAKFPNLSPEKCWLIIQTFIKGYELIDLDSYLDSAGQYQKIPQKERIISVAEFIIIRDRVWSWYLKYSQENQLWDDRDLVRTILALDCYEPKYTVVFCDEAQDFTRLELQLIMKLSVFSLYNLEREAVFSLPFAFAGDPLQTLNPSGFSWTGFKAAFHDEILTPLGLNKNKYIELKLQQLEYNYRSAAPIVKVNNLIQLWRKSLFKLNQIQPQRAKKQNSFIPQKLILQSDTDLQELYKKLKETIILIPCDEGAEAEFIKEDEFLNIFARQQKTLTPWNILSAISAKGLEFPQVAIYRFGEACKLHLNDVSQPQTEEDKYFLNKLYVAASRATDKLLIIDSLEGEIKLWSYASDRNFLNSLINRIEANRQEKYWQENIELITTSKTIIGFNSNDPELLAAKFASVGKEGNIDFLNRAIKIYQETNNKEKADACLALKLKLERQFSLAGEIFVRLNQLLEAAECFWQAQNWQQLQSVVAQLPRSQHIEIERFQALLPIINFMAEMSPTIGECYLASIIGKILSITDTLASEIAEPKLLQKRSSKSWQNFLNIYIDCVRNLTYIPQSLNYLSWLKISQILIKYQDISYQEDSSLILKTLYFSRDYYTLIKYWEEGDLEVAENYLLETKYYYLAKAKTAKFPDNLQHLLKGKLYRHIIYLWASQGKPLDLIWLEYVAPAFTNLGNYHNALILYCQLNRSEEVEKCWQKIANQPLNQAHIKKLLNYYFQQQLWDRAIALARLQLNSLKLKCNFIYCLANSQLTPQNITPQQRQQYQHFITTEIINNQQWQKYLTIPQLGKTLEKIGAFNLTLTFYQKYLNSVEPQIRQFTRHRWIVTKQKQIRYFQATSKLAKAKKSQQSLTAKIKRWNLDLNSITSQQPSVKQLKSPILTSLTPQGYSKQLEIIGLPEGTKIQTLPQGIQQFRIQHLLLRIAKVTSKLAIIDLQHQKHLILDWRKGKVKLDTTILIASGNQPLLIADTLGQYQAIFWRQNNPRLELQLNNHAQKIMLIFENR